MEKLVAQKWFRVLSYLIVAMMTLFFWYVVYEGMSVMLREYDMLQSIMPTPTP